ncbi:hypothetical protein BU16DRAFT_47745 [Lophium mytilinum]|uniref:Uncharacterized protein n=1 Tax=Lophium mytilinum TaxID=390894 RepID=A0A6A6QS07_9PEZI|nr:hypothetical protein BU16DRAFT_47745 [Lophium mytilinum]
MFVCAMEVISLRCLSLFFLARRASKPTRSSVITVRWMSEVTSVEFCSSFSAFHSQARGRKRPRTGRGRGHGANAMGNGDSENPSLSALLSNLRSLSLLLCQTCGRPLVSDVLSISSLRPQPAIHHDL